jgi:hypothetical protein
MPLRRAGESEVEVKPILELEESRKRKRERNLSADELQLLTDCVLQLGDTYLDIAVPRSQFWERVSEAFNKSIDGVYTPQSLKQKIQRETKKRETYLNSFPPSGRQRAQDDADELSRNLDRWLDIGIEYKKRLAQLREQLKDLPAHIREAHEHRESLVSSSWDSEPESESERETSLLSNRSRDISIGEGRPPSNPPGAHEAIGGLPSIGGTPLRRELTEMSVSWSPTPPPPPRPPTAPPTFPASPAPSVGLPSSFSAPPPRSPSVLDTPGSSSTPERLRESIESMDIGQRAPPNRGRGRGRGQRGTTSRSTSQLTREVSASAGLSETERRRNANGLGRGGLADFVCQLNEGMTTSTTILADVLRETQTVTPSVTPSIVQDLQNQVSELRKTQETYQEESRATQREILELIRSMKS